MRYLLIVVFSIFSYAGLIHVFAAGMTGSPVSYIFYTLSAAALVADVWALRNLYRLFRNHLKDFPVLYRLVTDFPFRKQITFSAGFLISFLNAVIHLLAGLKAVALWQILLGLFFLVLCGAKSVILGQHIRGTDADAEGRKLYRRVGVLILVLCIPLAAILVMMELQGYSYAYRGYLIYGMAAIVFYNVILSTTKADDLVLDPFFGTGTTGAIAKRLGRHYVGIEREESYIKAATKRIQNTQLELTEFSDNQLDVKPPRFSIKQLIERGYLSVGQTLYSKDKKHHAVICPDGNVQNEDTKTSIHKMSALFLNRTNNNGWDYFWCEYDGEFVTINSLRYLANEKGGQP